MASNYKRLFQLIRRGLEISNEPVYITDDDTWKWIYAESQWQSVSGIVFRGIELNAEYSKPPSKLIRRWTMETECLKKLNNKFNKEAERLTTFFDANGIRSTILKGQGNEMLYPESGYRSPGDIDIYLEGGKEYIKKWLRDHDLMKSEDKLSRHHVHIKNTDDDIEIEGHFLPSSGIINNWKNRRLLRILNEEITHSTMTERGFRVPTCKFNLLMQLAHIQRHFIQGGIGARHITDYYFILRHAAPQDRQEASQLISQLGLGKLASALMWVLGREFLLDQEYMIASPDKKLGKCLLKEICIGGNFGSHIRKNHPNPFERTSYHQKRALRLIPFGFSDFLWSELGFLRALLFTMPERIRQRKLSLGG